jgi:uncharacterized protein (DUF952 family)
VIYKILRAPEFAAFVTDGATLGSAADLADGFIHFSTPAQAPATAAKHFAGERRLWLVACDEAALGDALKWEPSRGGALFPHLYRPLKRADVLWAKPLRRDGDAHRFPDPPAT